MNHFNQINKNELLSDIFDNTFVGMVIVDENRNIKVANDAFCKLYGYEKNELENQSTRILHINDTYFNDFKDLAFNKIREKQSVSVEYKFKKKDGSTFWGKISGDPAKKDTNALWMVVDISETIRVKDELKEQTNLLETIINENPNPIVLKNYDAKFVFVNKATATLYNSTPEEMVGKDDGDYIPDKELSDFFKKNVQEIMNDGKTQIVYEDSIDVKTNEVRNYMSIKRPFKNKHDEDFILVIANDITELNTKNKELANKERLLFQQSKLAAMGEMIGNIAHQWRQPLSSISILASGVKLEQDLDMLKAEDLIQSMDSIIITTQYLSQTIDDFRTFYDPQNSKISIFNIQETINKTFKLVNLKVKNDAINIIKELEDFEIKSFKNELTQVIVNILNNAKDALSLIEEPRFIKIESYQDSKYAYIDISDNAKGIPLDIMDKIFEPYFTTKHKSQGTGIGLFMSKEIMQKHLDGQISVNNSFLEVDNIKYNGVKFTIKLPLSLTT
jgi:PAS domain S-box-containing protein